MSIAKGWYPDPDGKPCERYWDGMDWTEQTRPLSTDLGKDPVYGKPKNTSNKRSYPFLGWVLIGIVGLALFSCVTGSSDEVVPSTETEIQEDSSLNEPLESCIIAWKDEKRAAEEGVIDDSTLRATAIKCPDYETWIRVRDEIGYGDKTPTLIKAICVFEPDSAVCLDFNQKNINLEEPVTISGEGDGQSKSFELGGGNYEVSYRTFKDCVYFADLELVSGEDFSKSVFKADAAVMGTNNIYNIEQGRYYISVITGPSFAWEVEFVEFQ